jgi:hypothetical protein
MKLDATRITSPTGLGIRNDPEGFGHYCAPRGKRKHGGLDFLCKPGQTVVCPISAGKVLREANPYETTDYKGLFIQGKHLAIKIFYLDPWPGIIRTSVKRGDPIGIAQDISERYGGKMEAHVHLAIISFNPELLIGKE